MGNRAVQSKKKKETLAALNIIHWDKLFFLFLLFYIFSLEQVNEFPPLIGEPVFNLGLCQGEVVGCIVWWVGLHPAQVITIQSIAFPEELTQH